MTATRQAEGQATADDALQGLRRVLVAEDEHLLARTLAVSLESLGLTVVGPVSDGGKAVELAARERPDLAILDIRMPEVDGITAGRQLYQELNVPVVILSAFSDAQYVNQSTAFGVFGYLLKPVDLDELRVGLAVAWHRYREHLKLTGQVADLETKLRNRKVIERAKGLLMKHAGIDEEEAMRRLQKQARDARKPMVELAQALIDANGLVALGEGKGRGN